MIRNYYFLVAGILSFFFAFGHSWYGHTGFINIIEESGLNETIKTSVFWAWNLPTVTTFMSGVALIVVSLKRSNIAAGIYLAWFVIAINAGRFIVFADIVGLRTPGELIGIFPQAFGVLFYIGIMYAGLVYNKRKTPNERSSAL